MQTYLILALERFILELNIFRPSEPLPLVALRTVPVSASRTIVINLRDALPLLNTFISSRAIPFLRGGKKECNMLSSRLKSMLWAVSQLGFRRFFSRIIKKSLSTPT
jgi:hypothetical protein